MIAYSAYFLIKMPWSSKTSILRKSLYFSFWTFNLTKQWSNICQINKTVLTKTNDTKMVIKQKYIPKYITQRILVNVNGTILSNSCISSNTK